MATRVQAASNKSATSVASLAVGSAQGWAAPTAGNLIVAWADSDSTVTVDNSMTAGPSVIDGNGAYFWYKTATGAETTFTFTPGASATIIAGVLEYSGAPTFDVQGTSTIAGTAGTTTTAVSVTTTGASGDLILAAALLHAGGGFAASPAWTNSFVNFQTVSNTGSPLQETAFIAELQTASSGTVSTSCSWTTSQSDRQELVIAFKLAATATQIPLLVMARPTT
jgi:hypothetical protein